VGNFHDENNWEIDECDKDKFKELFDKACAVVTDKLKLNIPLIGEVKYGRDWSETH
jgi:DNA polymerase I-like protein with 3'-5' exonuclease and polymerase domains